MVLLLRVQGVRSMTMITKNKVKYDRIDDYMGLVGNRTCL